MKKVVAFGNPLLDTIILINNDCILQKYGLQANGQKEISEDEMRDLKEDIKNCCNKTVTAGGCVQNTLRVLEWLLPKETCFLTMVGAVGDDEEGRQLKKILEEHNVETFYSVHNDYPTGTTVALVNGDSRSLVAHLGAAEKFCLKDITENPKIMAHIESSNIVYIEGFFLTNRVEAATYILNYCVLNEKTLAFNLCGEYLCKQEPKVVIEFIDKSNIVFGNRCEFEALLFYYNQNTLEQLLETLGKQGKTVLVTNGAAPIVCIESNSKQCQIFDVFHLNSDEVVDTTGAGDAFVAGFIAAYLLKKSFKDCIQQAVYAAQEIIKRKGCTVPDYLPCIA